MEKTSFKDRFLQQAVNMFISAVQNYYFNMGVYVLCLDFMRYFWSQPHASPLSLQPLLILALNSPPPPFHIQFKSN